MPLLVKDRVKETSTTGGTGTITLSGAVAGFQSFSAVGNGNSTTYAIVDNVTGDWEVGMGTYTASGTTLSRTTVLSSSAGGALVNFATNAKEVFVTFPASSVSTEYVSITLTTSAYTLTSTSPRNIQVTSTTNKSGTIKLPNATTMVPGSSFNIVNTSPNVIRIVNTSDVCIGFVLGSRDMVITLGDNSTSAGEWTMPNNPFIAWTGSRSITVTNSGGGVGLSLGPQYNVVEVSSELYVILWSSTNLLNIYGQVYNAVTGEFGTQTTVITGSGNFQVFNAIKSADNQVLLVYGTYSSTAFAARTLSISGTTITVNTAATRTLTTYNLYYVFDLKAMGSAFVAALRNTSNGLILFAFTISGTTVTIGTQFNTGVAGAGFWTDGLNYPTARIWVVSSAVLVFVAYSSTLSAAIASVTLSGTTFTAGTTLSTFTFFSNSATYRGMISYQSTLDPTKIAVVYCSNASTPFAHVYAVIVNSTTGAATSSFTYTVNTSQVSPIALGAASLFYENNAIMFVNPNTVVILLFGVPNTSGALTLIANTGFSLSNPTPYPYNPGSVVSGNSSQLVTNNANSAATGYRGQGIDNYQNLYLEGNNLYVYPSTTSTFVLGGVYNLENKGSSYFLFVDSAVPVLIANAIYTSRVNDPLYWTSYRIRNKFFMYFGNSSTQNGTNIVEFRVLQ